MDKKVVLVLTSCALVMIQGSMYSWPTLRSIDNGQGSFRIRVSAVDTNQTGSAPTIVEPGRVNHQLTWEIPGGWIAGFSPYIKLEFLSYDNKNTVLKTYYVQLLQANNSSPKLATIKTDLQGPIFAQLKQDVENVSIRTGETPVFYERNYPAPGTILRDGCLAEGDPCQCSDSSLRGECKSGYCFKGFQYGDSSIYCNCNLHMLSNAEIKEREKKYGPLPTDKACRRKSAFGYSEKSENEAQEVDLRAKGLEELGEKLKELQQDGLLFKTEGTDAQSLSRDFGDFITIKKIIDEVVVQILHEMDTVYGMEGIPSIDLINIYENEADDGWKKPCVHFTDILQQKIKDTYMANLIQALRPFRAKSSTPPPQTSYLLSDQALSLIAAGCPEHAKPKDNSDPCICGNTKKPGNCGVNSCESFTLKCRCD